MVGSRGSRGPGLSERRLRGRHTISGRDRFSGMGRQLPEGPHRDMQVTVPSLKPCLPRPPLPQVAESCSVCRARHVQPDFPQAVLQGVWGLPGSTGLPGWPLRQDMLRLPQGPQPSRATPGLCVWGYGDSGAGREAKHCAPGFCPWSCRSDPVLPQVQVHNSMCSEFIP